MKHPIYHTKRFWKLIAKEFQTRTNAYGEPYIYLCHGSPFFKEQWQLADFRAFCRLHASGNILQGDEHRDSAALFVPVSRDVRLEFLAHMVSTISLRSRKSL